jgi:hypothetical protein
MHQKKKDIQKRYEGFLQTNSLWKKKSIQQLNQFKIIANSRKIDVDIDDKLRLGKYIERFVSFQLNQEKSITVLCENIQIQKDKVTLGELDCIIQKENKTIHLEITYKFYLYDTSVGKSEIDHFIGPNRNDSLSKKLKKLKEKQFPLLYSDECTSYLNSINLTADGMEQKVYFKAQLFLPFFNNNIRLKLLNEKCITGYYIHQKELTLFKNSKFYIPNKKDWIVIPHKNVTWLNYEKFQQISIDLFHKKTAPLCWVKLQNGEILKLFLVWWPSYKCKKSLSF